ncbi:hypothetical protein DFQ27_000527 [Actinomortierella ambigua]|uniref:Uncharacterized protein n=1 Tax=Actinomortierella ambigua TaxID=1343610 RepID=A0A9P6QCH3_9FUNG|nr:hypothetical protein DFQ26_007766 [Actinomortierella ambigua]KAG0265577.1 hypothetical protein DFQ27_000527 [Actinomortierella ambigua]
MDQTNASPLPKPPQQQQQPLALDAAPIVNDSDLRAIANELAQEFSVESLSRPAVSETQHQIQTVAIQMDGLRTQINQIQSEVPLFNKQTEALLESAESLKAMYRKIDDMAILVERLAASMNRISGQVDEAEKELSSNVLQPFQAVLDTFKMGPKGFR